MSQTLPYTEKLDLREQIARIDRMLAETEELQEETRKFAAETRKVTRDYGLAPWLLGLAGAGAAGGVISALAKLLFG